MENGFSLIRELKLSGFYSEIYRQCCCRDRDRERWRESGFLTFNYLVTDEEANILVLTLSLELGIIKIIVYYIF